MTEKRERISNLTAAMMIIFTSLLWGLQVLIAFAYLIPVIGDAFAMAGDWMVGFFGDIVMFVWFSLFCGVNMFGDTKKTAINVASWAAEMIPFINDLPDLVVSTVFIIYIVRQEDKKANAAREAALRARNRPELQARTRQPAGRNTAPTSLPKTA